MKLNILTIGSDESAVDINSNLAERAVKYGKLVDKYIIVVPAKKSKNVILSDNTLVYGVKLTNAPFIVSRFLSLFQIYKLSRALIKKNKLNIISVQDPFEFGLVGWLLAKKFNIALNIQEHGNFFGHSFWRDENYINFIRYYLGGYIIKKANSVRVVSKRIKNNIEKDFKIPSDKIINVSIFIKNKIKNKISADLENKYDGKFIFLWMGRFVKQKNLKLLVESFKSVTENNKNAYLILVGSGPLKNKIVNLTKELKIENNVEFVEWTDDIYSYYNLADVYVLSSNYEGWGRVIIEAASFGLPIIMTDVGCAKEVIKDRESGIVVPIGDKERLSEAMVELQGNKKLREYFAANAKKEIEKLPKEQETLNLYLKSWIKCLNK